MGIIYLRSHNLNSYLMLMALLLLLGCTELQGNINELTDATFDKPIIETNLSKMYEQQAALVDNTNTCSCMVCSQYTPIISTSTVPSLYKGNCEFFSSCSRDDIKNISNNTQQTHIFVQRALIGQGPSMGTFRYANRFCNNSLSLATQWITRQNLSPYQIVSSNVPKCYLQKNIIPLYILYTKIGSPDPVEGKRFAEQFKDLGPVFIVSDFAANTVASRDDTMAIKDQLRLMKEACPNCLIGFGVRYGEDDFASAVLSDQATRNYVDFIGVGFDNKEIMRKQSICDPNVAITMLFVWSRNLTYVFDKPIVWAYLLLDKGTFEMGNGKQCNWNEDYNTQFIKIYYLQLQQLVSSGIIGSSMYSLITKAMGPLECENCGMFDITNQNGDQLKEFRHWFYFCQIAYSGAYAPIIHFPVGPVPECVLFSSNYQIPFATISIDNPLDPVLADPIEFTCTGCLYYMNLPDPYNRCIRPYSPGSTPGVVDPGDNEICNLYKDISDAYSDLYSIPPAITRAVMWQMSTRNGHIDKCAFYYATDSDPFCKPSPVPHPPYVSDPSSSCILTQPSQNERYCNFGLTGIQTAPFTYYNNRNPPLELPYNAKVCNRDSFNPFDPSDNLCSFGADLSGNLTSAYMLVDDNSNILLQKKGTEYETDERDLIAMFIALHMYLGDWRDSWISEYALINKNPNDPSCTNTDFIDYIASKNTQMYGYDFAYEVLKKYRYVIDACYDDFKCPS